MTIHTERRPGSHTTYDACGCGGRKDSRAIVCRACHLAGAPTEAEVDFLRANIDRMSWRELGEALRRPATAVRATAARFGIVKSEAAARAAIATGGHGNITAEERYWSHVVKSDGCWGWDGPKDGGRYGVFMHRRRRHKAHRFSYEIHVGPIAPGMNVCHVCDNPPCSRPDHLFAATQRDNMADASAKKRVEYGERHHGAKLTCARVVEARERHAAGERVSALARAMGVSDRTLYSAINRITWRHVA